VVAEGQDFLVSPLKKYGHQEQDDLQHLKLTVEDYIHELESCLARNKLGKISGVTYFYINVGTTMP
jgi:hypothetical protein